MSPPANATTTALLRLRELLLSGVLPPGERLSELSVVERLGVSRTPVRAALARLEDEGFLDPLPSGGYAVRDFPAREIDDAIELRGTLEGLAARFAAERGTTAAGLHAIKATVVRLDGVGGDFEAYQELNARFHAQLVDLADSPPLAREIARVTAMPGASPSGFVAAQAALGPARAILDIAQDQHRCVVEAIEKREGTRAEAIMREHARLARRNLQLALADRSTLHLVPGGALIGRRA